MKAEHMKQLIFALYDSMLKATVENAFPSIKDDVEFNEIQKKQVFTPEGPKYVVTFILVTSHENVRDAFAGMLSDATDELKKATGSKEKAVHVFPNKGRLYAGSEHIGDFQP